ncbi:MAG: PSD1 and planctomycete cytochrome C domain-containing protein [Acidobacteriota bacterium]
MLRQKCAACHDGQQHAGGFSISTAESLRAGGARFGPAVVAGHPESSSLLRIVRGELAPRMPLGGELAPTEIAAIETWIRNLKPTTLASVSSAWNPFVAPVRPAVPQPRDAAWVRNPIDAFILSRIEAAGLKPAPAAHRRTLARRLYLDLAGMPPTREELAAFVDDTRPDAYVRLVDRLLDDPRYGERWGRHWLDLARYGETSGLEGDGAIGNVWRYRDWVIDAFNRNMPYDRFVLQQIAGGDEHSKTRNNYQPDEQGLIPTAFLRVAPWDRSNLVAAEVRANYLAEVTTATSSVFLGLTVGCARCHDHKYDPIPQKDFYRLQAFFQATQAAGAVPVPFSDRAMAERSRQQSEALRQRLKDGPEKQAFDALEKELLAKLIAERQRRSAGQPLTKNDLRLEIKLEPRRIFTEAESLHHARLLEDADRTGDAEEKALLDTLEDRLLLRLKTEYASAKLDPTLRFNALTANDVRSEAQAKYSGKSIFTVVEKNRYAEISGQLNILRRRLDRWQPNVLAVTNVPGPPSGPDIAPVHVLVRGDYRQPGEIVEAGFPIALTGQQQAAAFETDRYRQYPTRGRRITLARWIASPKNPLTARVMVNRLWQQHFGSGIVRTPSDFGRNGEKPTHPELLDWLAVEFVESGWDIKHMHRLMLLSATWQQSAENPGADEDSRLFSRFSRRRLEAEAIRDSILAVSGRLNREMHGPSVFPPLPADLADFARYGRTGDLMWEPNPRDEDARRRSVYIFQRRSLPLPMMASFDAIVFSESCDRRVATTTPLQALSLMNGSLVEEESAHLAARILEAVGPDPARQIERAFEHVLNRPPDPAELQRFRDSKASLAQVIRVLFSSNEFVYTE